MCLRKKLSCFLLAWLLSGCALLNDSDTKKPLPSNLIATPASYYSTSKARYLGSKYKDHLDRLTERIVRNSTTAQLQFANNISSVGGIGFFTHSATKTPDERYLEVVLSTPETFETKGEYSLKVNQLFSRYGQELLAILAGDNEIFQDKELAGYGLNLMWRNVISDAPANRVSMARAIIYFHKERVQGFLQRNIGQNELLGDAVIFAVEDDGPLNLVSYQAREIKPDFRPAIREDNLAEGAGVTKPSAVTPAATEPAKQSTQKPAVKTEPGKKELPVAQSPTPPRAMDKPNANVESPESAPSSTQDAPASARSAASGNIATPKTAVLRRDTEPEKVASGKQAVESRSVKPVPEISLLKPAPADVPDAASKADRAEAITKMPPVKPARDETTAANPPEKMSIKPAEAKSIQPPAKRTEETKSHIASTPVTKADSQQATLRPEDSTKNPETVATPSVAAQRQGLPTREIKVPISAPVARAPVQAEVKAAEPVKAVEEKKNDLATQSDARKSAPEPIPSAVAVVPKEAPTAPEKLLQKPAVIAEKTAASPRAEIAQAPIAKAPSPAGVKIGEPVKAVEEKKIDAATKPDTRRSALDPVPSVVAAAPKDTPSAPEKLLQKPTANAEKPAVSRPAEITPASNAKLPAPVEVKASEANKIQSQSGSKIGEPSVAKTEAPAAAVAAPQPVRLAEVKRSEPMVRAPAEKPTEPIPARKAEPVQPAPIVKAEIRETKAVASAPVIAPNQEKLAAAPEQLALVRKPVEPSSESALLARPAPKPLHGFIIQVAFNDKQKAQSWAEKMTQRGYAVSVTEAGAEGALRVRLGNFTIRDEAERQLQSFKQEGMNGIIINLPQAFRPEARSSMP